MDRVDVDAVLDGARFRGLPLAVAVCAILVLVCDGLDMQILSVVAPVMMQEFGIDRGELGPVLTMSLIGMTIGAFVLGGAGDRYGRRPLLLSSTALFALTTLGAASAGSVDELMVWRLATGIGLGGALPNAVALLSEYAPLRLREWLVALAGVGVPIGGMLGAAIATEVVPAHGWRAMLVVGGVAPGLLWCLLLVLLPESPRFLATRGSDQARLAALLNRIAVMSRFHAGQVFHCGAQAVQPVRAGVSGLLASRLRRDTLGLWLLFFTNLFSIFTFFSWAPVILSGFGLPLRSAVFGLLVFNLAGVGGGVLTAWSIGRHGSRRAITFYALCAVAALFALSRVVAAAGPAEGIAEVPLLVCIGITGFALIGIQTSLFRLATHIYPVACRASGIGWAAAIGRLGSIASSMTGGILLGMLGGGNFFLAMAGVAAFALAGVALIRAHAAGRRATIPPGGNT